jgi:hypothetical protein
LSGKRSTKKRSLTGGEDLGSGASTSGEEAVEFGAGAGGI